MTLTCRSQTVKRIGAQGRPGDQHIGRIKPAATKQQTDDRLSEQGHHGCCGQRHEADQGDGGKESLRGALWVVTQFAGEQRQKDRRQLHHDRAEDKLGDSIGAVGVTDPGVDEGGEPVGNELVDLIDPEHRDTGQHQHQDRREPAGSKNRPTVVSTSNPDGGPPAPALQTAEGRR